MTRPSSSFPEPPILAFRRAMRSAAGGELEYASGFHSPLLQPGAEIVRIDGYPNRAREMADALLPWLMRFRGAFQRLTLDAVGFTFARTTAPGPRTADDDALLPPWTGPDVAAAFRRFEDALVRRAIAAVDLSSVETARLVMQVGADPPRAAHICMFMVEEGTATASRITDIVPIPREADAFRRGAGGWFRCVAGCDATLSLPLPSAHARAALVREAMDAQPEARP